MIKVFIVTDLEGISGIETEAQILNTQSEDYRYSCERLMADTNAAITGAFEGGAGEVYVVDGHDGGNNFIPGALDSRAKQVTMSEWNFEPGEISAFMHIGAHAMAGTQNAFLDHTQSSITWHDYMVNGRRSGELAQAAIFAGAYGIPYIMVSGDAAACIEARDFLGDIRTVSVKSGIGRNRARCIPPDLAAAKIKETATASISDIGGNRPYKPIMPLEIKIVYNRSDYCEAAMEKRSDVERLDARTLRRVAHKITMYSDVMI